MATADSTKLEAVNTILRSSGFLPTSQLGTGRPDAIQAESILDETDREIQSRGWWFNTDEQTTLTPNASNEIQLGDDVYRVDSAEPNGTFKQGTVPLSIIKRGGKVYDLENLTFTFASSILVDLVRRLEFEDLPETARAYIRDRAARVFFGTNQDDPGRRQMVQENEARSRARFLQEAAEVADYNLFKNPDAGHAFQERRRLPRS